MEHLPPLGTPDNPAHSGQEIAEVLTAEIRHLQPGAQLPTEHELMSRFGAKRAAVRTALESLEARLLIKRVRGIGTFVNDRFDYLLSSDAALLSLHEVVQPTGALSEMRVISVDRVPLPEHQAQRFNVTDNSPLLRLTRIGSINGVESIHTQTLLLHPALQEIDAALPVFKSLTESIRSYGFNPKRKQSVVTVEDMPTEAWRVMNLEKPSLGSHVESLMIDSESEVPLLLSDTWFRLDAVRLTFTYR